MKSSTGISRPFKASLHHFNRSLEAGKAGSSSLLAAAEMAAAGVALAADSVLIVAGAAIGVAGFAACPASFEAIEYEDCTTGRGAAAKILEPFMPGGRTAGGPAVVGVLGLGLPTVCHRLSDAGAAGYCHRQNCKDQRQPQYISFRRIEKDLQMRVRSC